MKKWLTIAGILLGVGLVIALIGWLVADGDWKKLNNLKGISRTEEVESFQSLEVEVYTGVVRVVPAQDEKYSVRLDESDLVYYTLSVEEGTLKIAEKDDRKWYQCIGFSYAKMQVTVYLPAGEYEKLDIRVQSGEVDVLGVSCKEVNATAQSGDITLESLTVSGGVAAKVSSGEITVKDVTCEKAALKASSGDVEVERLRAAGGVTAETQSGEVEMTEVACDTLFVSVASGDIDLEGVISQGETKMRSASGNISFYGCDAASYDIQAASGNVKGKILTSKIFVAETGSGSIRVPDTTEGGVCRVETGSGNIRLELYAG